MLHITLQSFSYKNSKLIPKDEHGLGYVFDMRGIDNPGRIAEYKQLTGKNNAVQEYLKTKTEMPQMLHHIQGILDITVQNFIDRNFEHLMINFGCTGGQHRSVFAAEHCYNFLNSKYELICTIHHLEENNWPKPN